MIVIYFSKSRSKYYSFVRDRCVWLDGYDAAEFSPSGENEIAISLEEFREKWRLVVEILSYIGNWKSTNIFYDNKPVTSEYISRLGEIAQCYEQRQVHLQPEQHCLDFTCTHGWKCRFLDSVDRYYKTRSKTQWYRFGKFGENWIWHIDKDRIRKRLYREIKVKRISEMCPVFSVDHVNHLIDKLPDTLNPARDARWEYEYAGSITGFFGDGEPMGIRSTIEVIREERYLPFIPPPKPIIEISIDKLINETINGNLERDTNGYYDDFSDNL